MSARQVKHGPRKRVAPAADGLPREHVGEIQRLRILTAMADVAAENGAGAASVAHVVARAGVSRRTFYDIFQDREDCFLAAFEEVIAQAARTIVSAYRAQGKWPMRVRAGLLALLVFCEEQPALAKLCIVESLAAGPRALERRSEILDILAQAVEEGRGNGSGRAPVPPSLTGESIVGAVLSVIHRRLTEEGPEPLTPLVGELMSAIVLPYLGFSAAQKELHKPAPRIQTQKRSPVRDPLEGLEMRITYRTVRALIAIGTEPRASNRKVATAAGISDQGQVSKLLTRLENLGLVHNTESGHPQRASNAWVLTPKGQEVERAVRTQSASRLLAGASR